MPAGNHGKWVHPVQADEYSYHDSLQVPSHKGSIQRNLKPVRIVTSSTTFADLVEMGYMGDYKKCHMASQKSIL